MRKRKPVRMPESFSALLNYLQSKGYADASIRYFEGHFRNISIFLEDNGYASYTLEAYEAVLKHITKGCAYEDLTEYKKRCYHSAAILYEFQQTGSYTFRRKKAEEILHGGLKAEIEEFMEHRKSLLQSEVTRKQYHLDLLRFNIFLPYIFLKHMPPYSVVTGSAFTNAIKNGFQRAGISCIGTRKHGPHALRHSLANILLSQNTPLPVITGILGHKNQETTKMYLSIDLTSLRKCALNVPEIDTNYFEARCKQW